LRFLEISNELKHAMGDNELYLVYQPQYDIQHGCMIGAEVLLRWQSARLGAVSPAEFIPIAESSGLIIPISEWIISTAAAQLKDWCDQGLKNFKLAINLSAVQFKQDNLKGRLFDLVNDAGVSPEMIELELTEAVALEDPEQAAEIMSSLREQGFHLSIDDFGTGFSSMSYLKRFAVEKLKIDQSFVADLTIDHSDLAITTAIVEMAHGLGLRTIAEGVETEAQLKLLHEMGCDEIQGYFYSRPLIAEDFGQFIHSPARIYH
jgi:EAL domain-containing protein (putative c-di-GMP-specific phosphodiesterase class I)